MMFHDRMLLKDDKLTEKNKVFMFPNASLVCKKKKNQVNSLRRNVFFSNLKSKLFSRMMIYYEINAITIGSFKHSIQNLITVQTLKRLY